MNEKELLLDFLRFQHKNNPHNTDDIRLKWINDYLAQRTASVEVPEKTEHVGKCTGELFFDEGIEVIFCLCGSVYLKDTELTEEDMTNKAGLREEAVMNSNLN